MAGTSGSYPPPPLPPKRTGNRTALWIALALGGAVLLAVAGAALLVFIPGVTVWLRPHTTLTWRVGIQVQDAVKAEADRAIDTLVEELRARGIEHGSIDRNDPQTPEEADAIQIDVRGVAESKAADFRRLMADRFAGWTLSPAGATDYRLALKPAEALVLKREVAQQTVQGLSRRVEALGCPRPDALAPTQEGGDYRLSAVVPKSADLARMETILSANARFEITEVKDGPFANREQGLAKLGGVLPAGTRLLQSAARGQEPGEEWYVLARVPVISGLDVRTARPGKDEFGRWETDFVLTKPAGQRFGRYTEAHIGGRLAIVLEDRVRSAPTIQGRIEDSGRITGATSQQEAEDLAMLLRSGPLPAAVKLVRE